MIADVAVIGGGVIGRAIAFELARRRWGRVVLIDHGALGGEASPAAAALLPVASHKAPRGMILDMCHRSAAMYPAWLGDIREVSGHEIYLDRPGLVESARSAPELEALCERAARRRAEGFSAEVVERERLEEVLPGVAPGLAGAVFFPDECMVDARALLAALGEANRALGVCSRRPARVTSLEVRDQRVTALQMERERIPVGAVVIAAGWWSAQLAASIGARLPVRPARGQMLEVEAPPSAPPVIVTCGDASIIPRSNQRLWIGSTLEYEADPTPTAEGQHQLLSAAGAVLPRLSSARVTAQWAGLRPCSTLRRPIIDRTPGIDNLFVATGHHRTGFLLAPVTAAFIRALLAREPPPVPPQPVSWRRHGLGGAS